MRQRDTHPNPPEVHRGRNDELGSFNQSLLLLALLRRFLLGSRRVAFVVTLLLTRPLPKTPSRDDEHDGVAHETYSTRGVILARAIVAAHQQYTARWPNSVTNGSSCGLLEKNNTIRHGTPQLLSV